ncbi:MAG TPA: flagellar motor protein MotB [Bryobacteraceae bacterium]|nr:flagellar motor protein MotB [Bryobacteraceae bacterium]
MSAPTTPPIIIIKKKGGHGGHHGGAWKVAYADFVTAMMALFIVLWLLNSSEQVKKAISAYFLDPSGTGKQTGSAHAGTGEALTLKKDDMPLLKEKLEAAVRQSPEFEKLKDYVQMSVVGEGLRIEMLESETGLFFDSGSSSPSPVGKELIERLAAELGRLPNTIAIEGHTDARPYSSGGAYSNWELSTDRANAARRMMQASGVRPDQVSQVRGFADQDLREKNEPESASNRRISVIVRYMPPAAADEPDAEPAKEKPAEGEHHEPEKGPAPAHH